MVVDPDRVETALLRGHRERADRGPIGNATVAVVRAHRKDGPDLHGAECIRPGRRAGCAGLERRCRRAWIGSRLARSPGRSVAMTFRGWKAEALEFFEGLEVDNSESYWQATKTG